MPYVVLPSKKTQVQRGEGNEGLERASKRRKNHGAIVVKVAFRQKEGAQMTKVAIQPMVKWLAGVRSVQKEMIGRMLDETIAR